jgi:hypothetical protein
MFQQDKAKNLLFDMFTFKKGYLEYTDKFDDLARSYRGLGDRKQEIECLEAHLRSMSCTESEIIDAKRNIEL